MRLGRALVALSVLTLGLVAGCAGSGADSGSAPSAPPASAVAVSLAATGPTADPTGNASAGPTGIPGVGITTAITAATPLRTVTTLGWRGWSAFSASGVLQWYLYGKTMPQTTWIIASDERVRIVGMVGQTVMFSHFTGCAAGAADSTVDSCGRWELRACTLCRQLTDSKVLVRGQQVAAGSPSFGLGTDSLCWIEKRADGNWKLSLVPSGESSRTVGMSAAPISSCQPDGGAVLAVGAGAAGEHNLVRFAAGSAPKPLAAKIVGFTCQPTGSGLGQCVGELDSGTHRLVTFAADDPRAQTPLAGAPATIDQLGWWVDGRVWIASGGRLLLVNTDSANPAGSASPADSANPAGSASPAREIARLGAGTPNGTGSRFIYTDSGGAITDLALTAALPLAPPLPR